MPPPRGRAQQLYRIIDFKRAKIDARAKVAAIEYDPNRTALIALIVYADGTKNYILAPNGLKVGATVISAAKCENNEYRPGDAYPLETIPPSTRVHAVELIPGRGAQIAAPPDHGAIAYLAGAAGARGRGLGIFRRQAPPGRLMGSAVYLLLMAPTSSIIPIKDPLAGMPSRLLRSGPSADPGGPAGPRPRGSVGRWPCSAPRWC